MASTSFFATARINLSRLLTLGLIAGLGVSGSLWTEQTPWLGHLLALLGWALVGVGVVGRIWAASYICGHKNVKLLADGPYSITRNPLYLFSFIGGLGIMLITRTLFFPVLFAIIYLSYYQPVMRAEENTLRGIHGEAFEAYRRAVPLFWPRTLAFNEVEYCQISANHFRRFLLEVIWFVVIAGVVQLVERLHQDDILPNLFWVY